MVDFGNRLKSLRIKKGWTQAQLAQKLGLTKSLISAYETGIRLPSLDALVQIAKVFRVSTDYLLGVESKEATDFSGLTTDEAKALRQLIRAMRNNHRGAPPP